VAAEPALDPARHLRPARAREATGDGAGLVEAARRRQGGGVRPRAGGFKRVSGLLRPDSCDSGAAARLRSYGGAAALAAWPHTLEVRLVGGCVKK